MDAGTAALLAGAGFGAGAANAIGGGGSLISFPALLAAGYPSITANVTNSIALLPGYLGGSLAYRREEDVTFREELQRLERRLPNLRVVFVLSKPDAGWEGECGRIDERLPRRHAPRHVAAWSALVCGPAAMVAGTTRVLAHLGMAPAAVQAEGFE